MSKIRMIVSDLDGTLLDGDHRLSEQVEKNIREYISTGGLFTLATGRNWSAVRHIVARLGLTIPVILANGSVLADKQRILYQAKLKIESIADFLLEAGKNGYLAVLLFEHDRVYGFGSSKGIDRFSHKEKITCESLRGGKESLQNINPQKVVLVGDFSRSLELWSKYSVASLGAYSFLQSEDDFFEIVKQGENKGKAMLMLAQLLGVKKEEILAIGNHMNDKEMLLEAGIGAAVFNCSAELRKYADYSCLNAFGEGVEEVIHKFAIY
ncbi:HAD family hydrolase [Desulfosporosinus sp. FKA]|uniref:Cof-type HAD-IIB family hydrolase n=1 Tax=Desulfosporosinus sp. FKA TaxID=1969834 RepID=UPI000B4A26FA|nr:HAD family hydrolase [Desulfosporosinus sp. FKA]